MAKELKNVIELRLLKGSIRNETKENVSSIIKTRDTQTWRETLNDKPSVTLCKEHRKEIGQDEVYNNYIASDILSKCRTNTLKLNDSKIFTSEGTDCCLCDDQYENLAHFLLWCPVYATERQKSRVLQQPYQENTEKIIENLLLNNAIIQETKTTLKKFWTVRQKKIWDIENNIKQSVKKEKRP